jgi:guanylate kinase
MSLILAISGPAAVGKTTICDRLIQEFKPSLNRLITATTRAPRANEENGIDYYFLSDSEFEKKLSNDCFLEHEIIHGNKYGVLKETILEAQTLSLDILLNIDVNGTASLKHFCRTQEEFKGQLKTIFIKPQTLADLNLRLRSRASEGEEQIQIRLDNAKAEILREREFDFVIESGTRDSDYEKVKTIYLSLSKTEVKS